MQMPRSCPRCVPGHLSSGFLTKPLSSCHVVSIQADVWEPLYKKFCSYLDIPNRIEILNKRLDILKVRSRLLLMPCG